MKHHFIPAFYLGQWCVPSSDDKLLEYSIEHGNLVAKPVGRRATGFQRDLYAFPELPPDQAQFIEQRFFDYADRVASDALQKLLSGDNRWTPETRSAWSRFVIGVHLRHPVAIPELRAAARSIWDEEPQREYERIRKPSDPATFDELIAIAPLIPFKMEVNAIIKMLEIEPVCGRVNNMEWDVIDVSAASHRLLTSDRPVTLVKPKDRFGSITMPISPTKLFVAVNDRSVLNQLRVHRTRDIVQRSNTLTVERARRYVWAQDSSQEGFIRKHIGKSLEPLPLLGMYSALVPAFAG